MSKCGDNFFHLKFKILKLSKVQQILTLLNKTNKAGKMLHLLTFRNKNLKICSKFSVSSILYENGYIS